MPVINMTVGQFNSSVKDKKITAIDVGDDVVIIQLETGDRLVINAVHDALAEYQHLDVTLEQASENWTYS